MLDYIRNQVKCSFDINNAILENNHIISLIGEVSKLLIKSIKSGNKILIAGNGGSAADAQHIAGELVNRFYFDRPGLPAVALTTDTSVLTAIGNDYGFENIFSRQIQANGVPGDIFIGISTSGNSLNIIKALEECRKKKIITIGFTGQRESKIDELCDYCIKVPSDETPRIQECHIMIAHIICAIVEKTIFGKRF